MAGAGLKLLASDVADLEVIAAAAQDALVRARDLKFDPRARRFTADVLRFKWEAAGENGPYERVRAALAFDSVLSVKTRKLRRDEGEALADILSIKFDADAEPPGGVARIVLAGDGEIALTVECLDVTLADLGPSWPTQRKPDHEPA